jgi:Methyltransferase domain
VDDCASQAAQPSDYPSRVALPLDLFVRTEWQMAAGERAAIEGVLSQLKPSLAIELGTAQGGSLRCIAAHSAEVHSFDFDPQVSDVPQHVTLHRGDSHDLLPRLLRRLEQEGRGVDFALVDGDHSAAGVRRDLHDLLSSSAVQQTVILLHDTGNEEVRAGLAELDFDGFEKVAYVDLSFVDLNRPNGILREHWGGLGVVVADREGRLTGSTAQGAPVRRNLRRETSAARRLTAPLRRGGRRAQTQFKALLARRQ